MVYHRDAAVQWLWTDIVLLPGHNVPAIEGVNCPEVGKIDSRDRGEGRILPEHQL
jgi:hypothetical protein